MSNLLLISDSRGRGLEGPINRYCDTLNVPGHFRVIYVPGGRIVQLAQVAETYLRSHSCDLVFFMGGVNNLSVKHLSGKISPVLV